jgi:glutamate-1-semialdehyde 2,1-aminomutase
MYTGKTTEELKEILRQKSPKSAALWQDAQRVFPGGEVSAARTFDPFPFYAAEAEGAYIWDIDGNQYIDCCMCYGVHLLGHCPEPVIQALEEQMEHTIHYGAPHAREVEFAAKFVDTSPCADQILLCNSGFEAVWKAITVARAYTGREKIAKFEGGFHGAHEYSLWSVHLDPEHMGPPERPNLVPSAGGLPTWARDTMTMLPFGDENAFSLIEEHTNELAAVMIEPVLGAYVLPADKGFLEQLREVTRRTGVLLIFDEIITHYRMALGGGQEYYGVTPDIATYGKAIGGGLPIGAVGCSREIMEKVALGEDAIAVAGTFSGNAMTLAAGNAVLDYLLSQPDFYTKLAAKGDYLRDSFNEYANARGYPATMTGVGSAVQTHLISPPITKPRDCVFENPDMVEDFALLLRLNDIFIPAPIHGALLSSAHTDEDVEMILQAHINALEVCMEMHNVVV